MIPKLPFGRTGHESTRTLFGAAALGRVTQEEADATLEVLLKYGVNHIDTAASYGDAEERIGPWMPKHRDKFFLATKTEKRTADAAHEQIHRSLAHLKVSQLDLIQLHNLADEKEWEAALGKGGALEAAIKARDEGVVRFIGVTGHGVGIARMHIRSLELFDFDSVLLPLNYPMMQNAEYARDFNELAAICRERNVALQTIKSICRRPKTAESPKRVTWYEALEERSDIRRAVHWVFGNAQAFLNTAGDIHLLPKVLQAASEYTAPPPDEEMQAMHVALDMAPLFV
jgi:aryl-alcohol dehydrogenase-like predicted oxidoreductase